MRTPKDRVRPALRLVKRANDDLGSLGVQVPAERFVCPLCLRLLNQASATVGHYPAQSVPSARQTVPLCNGCNSFIGTAYESDTAAFFGGAWQVALQSPGGGRVRTRASVTQQGNQIQIRAHGRGFGREFKSMQARSSDPSAVQITLVRPTDANPQRALLAWSLLDWFHHASYNYLATPGAAVARKLVFEAGAAPRPGVLFARKTLDLPLPLPVPMLLTRSETKPESLLSPQEFVGVATRWGAVTVVLPWANDKDDRPWTRIEELMKLDGLRTIYSWPVLEIARRADRADIKSGLVISDPDSKLDAHVTEGLTASQLQELITDASPYRLVPPRSRQRETATRSVTRPKGTRPSA